MIPVPWSDSEFKFLSVVRRKKDFDKRYDPSQPRAPDGKWTDGGGTDHPGRGYSAGAKVIDGVIKTRDVNDAVRALWEGRKVELNQPREVSTLLHRLAAVSTKMIKSAADDVFTKFFAKLGGRAPNFDLCNVSVRGTNLFCAETKGIPRVEMPQIKDPAKFEDFLHSRGYAVEDTTEMASYLRATQNQLNGAKVAALAVKIQDGTFRKDSGIFISRDNYVLDGHHRWAAEVGVDALDNKLGDRAMRVRRVSAGITELLSLANEHGAGRKDFDKGYDPEQPRAEDGKWTGDGNSTGSSRVRSAYGGKLESTPRFLYHGSDRGDLDQTGIEPSRVDRGHGVDDPSYHAPYRRSFFTRDPTEAAEYGEHVYRLDLGHKNMSNHVFVRDWGGNQLGEYVTRQRVPPGIHLERVLRPAGADVVVNKGFDPDQPRAEDGKWTSSGGSSSQAEAAGELKKYAEFVGSAQGGRGTGKILADHGRAYAFDEGSFQGTKKTRGKCYQAAGRAALNDFKKTYVEGFISVHGVPIEHAWTVDETGRVVDPTLPDGRGVVGYYGVPFKTEYLAKTVTRSRVWGILSHTNRSILDEDPSEYVAKAAGAFAKYSPDQPRDDHGRWTSGGGSPSDAARFSPGHYAGIQDGSGRSLQDLLDARAPRSEVEAHPAMVKARDDSESFPKTHELPGYGTREFRRNRELVGFDGEELRGYDRAVDALIDKAEGYAGAGGVRDDRQAMVILGLPASGKSTYAEEIARRDGYAIVDSDDAKTLFREFRGGIGATAVHEESSVLGAAVLAKFVGSGGNVIIPKVGATEKSISGLTEFLRERGYDVHLRLVAADEDGAFRRGVSRFLKTGRLISGNYISEVDSKPDKVYERLKSTGEYASADVYKKEFAP